ncbi:MAG: hypothetical protein LC104_12955 [Bacteroidales bacterium]|nr:hypothetical protein [Bacteroidales bacterium]
MLNKLYLVGGSVVLMLYGWAAIRGWEPASYAAETPQQSQARHLSGGHRSHWISGYRGGK